MESLEKRFFRAAMEEEIFREMLSRLEMEREDFLEGVNEFDFIWEENMIMVHLDLDENAPPHIKEKLMNFK